MKDLTPNVGPHSHGIATRGQSTCRTDARPIARPTGDVDGLRRRLEHLAAVPDPVDQLATLLATSTETVTAAGARRVARRSRGVRRATADHSCEQTMTGAHRSPRAARATLWLPGLAVALGAAVATAHGLYEVALAAAVPAGIAWLYPLITDGLALVAYGATSRLTGSAARYAWAVVVTAAGLSGLAQAVYLASGATLDASPTLRFGIGAWPAVAAAVAAHLLYLLAAPDSAEPRTAREPTRSRVPLSTQAPGARVQQVPSNRPAVQPPLPDALDATGRPSPAPASRPTLPSTDPVAPVHQHGRDPGTGAGARCRPAARRTPRHPPDCLRARGRRRRLPRHRRHRPQTTARPPPAAQLIHIDQACLDRFAPTAASSQPPSTGAGFASVVPVPRLSSGCRPARTRERPVRC